MRTRSRLLVQLLAVLLGLSLVAAACGGDDDDGGEGGTTTSGTEETTATSEAAAGGTVLFGGEQEPTSLNWLTAADNAAWTQYVMQWVWPGVVWAQPDGVLEPNNDLVTSVELTSEDPQTVVYTIDPDATWSDGTPITADDFIFMWTAMNGQATSTEVDPDTGEPLPLYDFASSTGYELMESVTGSDDGKTVTVVYSEPFADWKAVFDYVFPSHYFTEVGGGDPAVGWNTGFKVEALPDLSAFVSGGPFTVTDYVVGESMTIERNTEYWGEKTPVVDEIVVPWITDAAQQPAALENGEADVIFPQAQIDLVQQTEGIAGVASTVGFGTFWEHVDFNLENPQLAVTEVRQAIAKAINRQEIVTRLPGQFSPDAQVLNNRIFMPSSANYEPNGEAEYGEQDIEAAKALMEQAGYALGADGVYAKDGQRASFRVTWRDPNPRRQQTAELIQAQLKEAGIEIVFAPQPDFLFLDEGNFDLALFGWTGGTVLSANTSIYVTDGGQNFGSYSNPEVDALLAQADAELDEATRADLMNQVDQLLWDDVPTIAMFQVPEFLAWRETVENVEYNGYLGPSWNSFTWSIAQ
ncbi:MAG: ABC transporter family substrate-binding protein [Acidimicrobiales bacterium]|nr:ABC transporter family substrate-binding protein [Acidimicrobiales bacterium]